MQKILAELEEHPESVDWVPPEDIDEKVFAEIRKREDERARAQLSDEDKKLLQYGKMYKKQIKHRKYWVLAAVLVMVLAVGMTSMGGPEKIVQRMTRMLSGREQAMVDTGDDEIKIVSGWEEEKAYDEIEEKFGFYPVRMDYLPEGVVFEEMMIGDEIQGAQLLYEKEGKLSVEFFIRANYQVGSMGADVEDKKLDEYVVEVEDVPVCLKKYQVSETKEIRWSAEFVYNKAYYCITLHQSMEEDQMKAIINGLILM